MTRVAYNAKGATVSGPYSHAIDAEGTTSYVDMPLNALLATVDKGSI